MFGQTAFRPNAGMATAALVVGLFALPAASLYGVPGRDPGDHGDRPRIARPWPDQAFSRREGWRGRGVGGHDHRPVRGRAGGDLGFLSDAAVPGHDADSSAVDLTLVGPRRMGGSSHLQETVVGRG